MDVAVALDWKVGGARVEDASIMTWSLWMDGKKEMVSSKKSVWNSEFAGVC